ncbi:restriction endonuclease subunit S [Mesorhizobium sp.]|uniref:restriction endonuclease subunit S n=1 Tax=Mesorhizobium sp. TaxID=1871066 RepID=UPI000FE583AE|nr:restriction endonuclease subunit S [Mesorhizobium sp.]RWM02186.1 MAG: hypothetical protein EOR71_28735 [Mesorhizobium sp.]
MKASPKGWAEDTLGGLGEWCGGGTPNKSNSSFWTNGDIPWVSPKDMKQTFIDGAEDHITADAVRESATQLISEGSVLIVTRSGILRHTLPVGITTRKVAINQDLKALTPFPAVDPVFAGYQIRSLGRAILSTCAKSGTTVDSIDFQRLKGVTFAVPPLHEQRRIVAKIDSLTGKSRRARDHLDHIPRLVEKYKQAVLAAAFRGALSPELGRNAFALHPLSRVTSSTFYGPRIAKEAYVHSGIPTLRTTDIADWGRLEPKEPPQVKVSEIEFTKWRFEDGDLMVTRTGATIGKCAAYEATMGPALPSAYLIRVRLNLSEADPRFVTLFLLSPEGQRQLLDGRTAVAQPNINADAITSVRLPVPPLKEQRAIVARVERMFAWIDRLAAEATSARRLIDHLDRSVLAKAFRGELVPQDPADEPASVLLERIRAERGAPKAKRARRSGQEALPA